MIGVFRMTASKISLPLSDRSIAPNATKKAMPPPKNQYQLATKPLDMLMMIWVGAGSAPAFISLNMFSKIGMTLVRRTTITIIATHRIEIG